MMTAWWKFWHRREPGPSREAVEAHKKAERALAATRAQTPFYRELAESLIEIQRTNHLGQAAARVLRGDR